MTAKTYEVTEEQLDACTRVINEQTRETFYLVQSASDPEKVYKVTYNMTHHCLSCTCPAMNPPTDELGYAKYMPRICWHIRAVDKHNRQYHELKKAEAIARQRQEEEKTLRRVMNAKPASYPQAQ